MSTTTKPTDQQISAVAPLVMKHCEKYFEKTGDKMPQLRKDAEGNEIVPTYAEYCELFECYKRVQAWMEEQEQKTPSHPELDEEPTAYLVFDCIWIYDRENDSLGDHRDNDEYFETYEEALECWQDRISDYKDPDVDHAPDAVYLEAMGGDLDEFNLYPIDTADYWERIPMDKYISDERAKE